MEARACNYTTSMATDAEQVEEVVDRFAQIGFRLAVEWRDRSGNMPHKYRRLGQGY
jgi:hypothetical protein